MARILTAKEVTGEMMSALVDRVAALREKGKGVKLAVIRCGEEPSDLSYERGAEKRASEIGAHVVKYVLDRNVTREEIISVIDGVNSDESIDGVLMFRPLPGHLKKYESEICNRLRPEKDVDCMTDLSMAGVFEGKPLGFAPCTPEACIRMLDYYGIGCEGKRAVVIGRSLVVGKPVAMMLLAKNATVTVCHTKTRDLAEITKSADIIVTAAGALGSLTGDFVSAGQTVIDVSMNYDPEKITPKGKGGMAGDAVFSQVEGIVDAITPVPGGVGAVTGTVLMEHLVTAAERKCFAQSL